MSNKTIEFSQGIKLLDGLYPAGNNDDMPLIRAKHIFVSLNPDNDTMYDAAGMTLEDKLSNLIYDVDELESEYNQVTSTIETLDGKTYNVIKLVDTTTPVEILNSDGKVILTQTIRRNGYLYICVGNKGDYILRKTNGKAIIASERSVLDLERRLTSGDFVVKNANRATVANSAGYCNYAELLIDMLKYESVHAENSAPCFTTGIFVVKLSSISYKLSLITQQETVNGSYTTSLVISSLDEVSQCSFFIDNILCTVKFDSAIQYIVVEAPSVLEFKCAVSWYKIAHV